MNYLSNWLHTTQIQSYIIILKQSIWQNQAKIKKPQICSRTLNRFSCIKSSDAIVEFNSCPKINKSCTKTAYEHIKGGAEYTHIEFRFWCLKNKVRIYPPLSSAVAFLDSGLLGLHWFGLHHFRPCMDSIEAPSFKLSKLKESLPYHLCITQGVLALVHLPFCFSIFRWNQKNK